MADLIASGSLRAGDRVPSVRRLSRQQKVSIPTVLQAYVTLENQRLIEARPKSGFFVKPRLSAALAEPRRINQNRGRAMDGACIRRFRLCVI